MKNKRGMELLEKEVQPGSQKLEKALALGNSRILRRQYGRLDSPNLGYRTEDYQVYVQSSGRNMTSSLTFPTPFASNSSVLSTAYSTPASEFSSLLSFSSISSTTDQMFSILPISVTSEDSFPASTPLASDIAPNQTSEQNFSILPISVTSTDSFPTSEGSSAASTETSDQIFSILPFSFPTSSPAASGSGISNAIIPATYTPFPSVQSSLPSSESSPTSQSSGPSIAPSVATPSSDVIYTYPLLTPVPLSEETTSISTAASLSSSQLDILSTPAYNYPGGSSVATVSSSVVVTYLEPPAASRLFRPLILGTPIVDTPSSLVAPSSSSMNATTALPLLSSGGHPFGILPPISEASAILASRASESAASAALATPPSSDTNAIQATYEPPYVASPSSNGIQATYEPPYVASPSSNAVQATYEPPYVASTSSNAIQATYEPPYVASPSSAAIQATYEPPHVASSSSAAIQATYEPPYVASPSSAAIQATYEPPYMTASPPSSTTPGSIIIGPNTPVAPPSTQLSSLIASISASLSAQISSSMASSAAIAASSTAAERFVSLPSSLSVPAGCPVPDRVTVTVYGSMPPPSSTSF
ncbi:uncharacterized protein BKA78DRAFT_305706 [Phyllosticta capitalensis]|uniref:uncharacterized protein n=1 Tax=Phyllosticta capitalensis TaxID=121624 RepID=UPI00312CF411